MIQFADKVVSYDTFMNDLVSRIVSEVEKRKSEPEIISKRKAYEIFGRANVDRWMSEGKLTIRKRPGKVELLTAELRRCQAIEQDYLTVVRRT
jgi:hypothetical protein